ncbi:ABC transport system integral membrane protein [Streptomyces griseoaurantiacus M045]|uniref:ABC transport system integral membrane protein n=1 Tax=Streptomyces griseoaurantiacus M045 TaxID=996637 RepID=F3NTL9_9ACTN|nr:ABC transport system integral membrane protein [Streptomyces griseoaurantiacus M045]
MSFVMGGAAGTALVDFLPDHAGQVALHRRSEGSPGPWSGLAVTALWTAAALGPAGGAWSAGTPERAG